MDLVLHNGLSGPSRTTLAFLKLFAHNYKEVELPDGKFSKMILK